VTSHSELLVQLVAVRKKNGLSLQQVADRMYTTPQAVSLLESYSWSNKKSPTLVRLMRYAEAVGAELVVRDRVIKCPGGVRKYPPT
jgi:transcriptional regulator with XRE-family HTH domain